MIFSKKKSQLKDEELILKYQKDHRKKWVGELFNRHAHLIFGVCLKYLQNDAEAKDATLDIFEKLFSELKSKEVRVFTAWVYIVAKNHCLMILRKQNTSEKRIAQLNGNESESGDELEDKILNEQKLSRLEETVMTLKDEQQVCVRLFYLEQKCYQEVADKTGFTIKQVKSFIQNGKRNLKLKLLQQDEFKV